MGIFDEYKSIKNRDLIFNAATKMIKDKFNININNDTLLKLINNIISVISNDAILLNKHMKLTEYNNLTLAKIKEYIGKQIHKDNDLQKPKDDDSKIYDDDELLSKVQELEEKRRVSSTILSNITDENIKAVSENLEKVDVLNSIDNDFIFDNIITDTESKFIFNNQKHKSLLYNTKKYRVKKTFMINTFDRDWILQPLRNTLQFKISIDLQLNIVEPLKILFPLNVKTLTPYVNMLLTDSLKLQKYIFLFNKNIGDWDEWILIDNQNVQPINVSHNEWKITFTDFINKELRLGSDDIIVTEISNFGKEGYCAKISFDKNYDYLQNSIKSFDYILLKTFSSNFVNVMVLDNKIDTLILSNNNDTLKQEDFINSKILNYKAQYFIFFSYYSKEP
jgi:hypothetical protein